jgi:large repetitive protein
VATDRAYRLWSKRAKPTAVSLSGSETATIDIDSTGRMWLASDSPPNVHVRYSDAPYTSFSGPITLATNITTDDIAVVTAMPDNTIGVLWSNQNAKRYGFRTHKDGASPTTWSSDEVPAGASAVDNGDGGMADDHLNVAVSSNGTLYAAIKTSNRFFGSTVIGLLVRRPDGSWDKLHTVDTVGTRPIVLLNESQQQIQVLYTSANGLNDILVRTSSASQISFGSRTTLLTGGLNNVTGTKENWTDQALVLASNGSQARRAFLGSRPCRHRTPARIPSRRRRDRRRWGCGR